MTMQDHIYQEAHLSPMTVAEINGMTQRARALPPSGDQTHVLVPDGEDPWVISEGGSFYYCTVDRAKRQILVSRFGALDTMKDAELVQVWPGKDGATPEYLEIWSPELQYLDGKWYIYFALYNGQNGAERMYVLEGPPATRRASTCCAKNSTFPPTAGPSTGRCWRWKTAGSTLSGRGGKATPTRARTFTLPA
jgi:hypothetical protein